MEIKKKYYNKLYICQQNIFLILNEKQLVCYRFRIYQTGKIYWLPGSWWLGQGKILKLKKNTDSNTKTKDKCKHKRKTHKVKIRKRNYDSGYYSQSGITIQLFLGLLYNVPPQKGHNVFSAWVPLNLDLLVQLGSITSRCSGQISPQPSPLLRVTKDCTQETAEIEPRCN